LVRHFLGRTIEDELVKRTISLLTRHHGFSLP
jgi:hypothetical protein